MLKCIVNCYLSHRVRFQRNSRGRYLQLVYDYLLSIPPTSVEAERASSASGLICSRLRTRLGDETLDALCFLRSYFQKQHLNDAAA